VNIWIFNHYAQGPDLPGGTRHYDLAKKLVAAGHRVTIFAAGFHYTLLKEVVEYNGRGSRVDVVDGVHFVWVKTVPYKKNDYRRFLNMVSYAVRLYFLVPRLGLPEPNCVVGSVVHPLAPIVGAYFAKKYKASFVYEIRDLWPQTFIDMGVWREKGFKARFFRKLERRSVVQSDLIITLSPKTSRYLSLRYGDRRVLYLPNGVDLSAFDARYEKYVTHKGNPTIDRIRLLRDQGKFIALFTGAIVKSNNVGLLLDCAERLHNKRIHIVIVGTGMERARFHKRVVEQGLNNIEFLDPVSKRLVPVLLRSANLLILVQGRVGWGSTNKLFDYMASGRPIVTALFADHNNVVREASCGFAVNPEDARALAEALGMASEMSKKSLDVLGRNGLEYVRIHNAMDVLGQKLDAALKAL